MRSVSQHGDDSEEEPATYENVQNSEAEESGGAATLCGNLLPQKLLCSLTPLIHSEGGHYSYEVLPFKVATLFYTIFVWLIFVLFRHSPLTETGLKLYGAETGLMTASPLASTSQGT